MIFSTLLRKTRLRPRSRWLSRRAPAGVSGIIFLSLLFALVSVRSGGAKAQCPGGKPPNKDGSCGGKAATSARKPERRRANPPRLRNRGGPDNCSINVRVTGRGGEPVAGVNLALDNSGRGAGAIEAVTNAAGAYEFTKLPCNRDYKITPAHPGFAFNLASITLSNLTKNGSATFIASPRENVASRKKTTSLPCNPAPKTPPSVKFGDSVAGKISPQTAWCEEGVKGYFHLYRLSGAVGGDIVQFDLQSLAAADAEGAAGRSADLIAQVVGGDASEIAPGSESDDAPRQFILHTAGDYLLRVIGKSDRPSDYRLSVIRKGLTEEGYRAQLEMAYSAISEPDSPTFYSALNQQLERIRAFVNAKALERKASEQKINEAAAVLERLRELAPDRPEAYSMLAAIHLYYRKDLVSAISLATKSLELGGEARFRVNFGKKLDQDRRRVTNANFPPCWLIIKKGKISCEGFKQNEGEIFNTNPEWIAKKGIDILNFSFGLIIYGEAKMAPEKGKRDYDLFEIAPYYFLPLSALDINPRFPLTEVSTIKTFIKRFVETKSDRKT